STFYFPISSTLDFHTLSLHDALPICIAIDIKRLIDQPTKDRDLPQRQVHEENFLYFMPRFFQNIRPVNLFLLNIFHISFSLSLFSYIRFHIGTMTNFPIINRLDCGKYPPVT